MSAASIHDLIILGGGPAGMTAAIYAARANLDTLVLECNITGGLVNSTYIVENFPSWPAIHGLRLMDKVRQHVDNCRVPVEELCEITELRLQDEVKTVISEDGEYKARAAILATGRRPVPLQTTTEAPQQVHHCAICDGALYVGKHVLVVGGGNSAFDESLYLLALGADRITLIEIMDHYSAAQSAQDALFSSGKAQGRLQTRVHDLIMENRRLKAAVLENTVTGERETYAVDGIFVFLGQLPNNALFRDQVLLTEQGYIQVAADMSTNIPGVFGAGDINDKRYRQIITAMADGAIAALAAERWLRTQKATRAL